MVPIAKSHLSYQFKFCPDCSFVQSMQSVALAHRK